MIILIFCAFMQAAPIDAVLDYNAYPFIGMLPELVVTASRAETMDPDTLDWLPLLTVYGKRHVYDGSDPNAVQYGQERRSYILVSRFVARHAGYILVTVFAMVWVMIIVSRINAMHHARRMEQRAQTIPLHMLSQNMQALKLQARKKNLHRYPKFK